MKFDVVEMLAWFASIVLSDAYYCASKRTGWSSVACFAEADYRSSKNNGLMIGVKATSSLDDSWWLLSFVAENNQGKYFTMSLSFDRDSILLGMEEDGVYTSSSYDIVVDVPWDHIINDITKALSKM